MQDFKYFLTRLLLKQDLFSLAYIFFAAVKTKHDAYHLSFLLDYSCYLFPRGDAETPQTEHYYSNISEQDTEMSVLSHTLQTNFSFALKDSPFFYVICRNEKHGYFPNF